MSHDRVRARLRDAAEDYQPDRAAIAKRVAAGRSAHRPARDRMRPARDRIRPARDRMRPAGAALAVAAVVGVAVVVVRLNDEPDRLPAAAPPSSAPAPVITPAPTPSATTAAPARTSRSFLTVAGDVADDSVATWTQHTVTVRTSRTVVDLVVTISVARTAGVAHAGRYTTVPNTEVTTAVRRTADALIYTYTLSTGRRLRPGTYEFAAQFDHRPGRERAVDSYAVDARTATAASSRSGRFG